MARRTSRRRRRTRRNSRRRSRRNPKYVVANRRRRRSRRRGSRRSSKMRRNRRRRRVRKNIFGADLMASVVIPVLGAASGFVAARYAGNMMAMKGFITSDPKMAKLIAAGAGVPLTFIASRQMPGSIIARNSGAIVTGMGIAAAESWLRDTPLLGGSSAAATIAANGGNGGGAPAPLPGNPPTPEAEEIVVDDGGDGLSSYYESGTGSYYESGVGADHYTAGMLGDTDGGDQSKVDASMDAMENGGGNGVKSVSTVIPTDMALRAQTMPQWAKVRERFAGKGDRAHAGGLFARHLFSGMMGA